MRVSLMGAIPVLAALTAAPAGAQISARVHVDIPIGRQQGVIYGAPRRQVVVRDYDEYQFGPWDEYYDYWEPVTLYYYDGYYYDYPVVSYARPIVVFSYRNQFFLPPRVGAYDSWRRTYRPNGRIIYRGGSPNYRPYQPAPRGRDDRYDPRRGNDGRNYQPNPRGGNDGRDYRPAPRGPGNGSAYPGRTDGHQGGPPSGGDRSSRGNGNTQDRGHGNVQGGHGGGNGRSRPRP